MGVEELCPLSWPSLARNAKNKDSNNEMIWNIMKSVQLQRKFWRESWSDPITVMLMEAFGHIPGSSKTHPGLMVELIYCTGDSWSKSWRFQVSTHILVKLHMKSPWCKASFRFIPSLQFFGCNIPAGGLPAAPVVVDLGSCPTYQRFTIYLLTMPQLPYPLNSSEWTQESILYSYCEINSYPDTHTLLGTNISHLW